MIDDADGGFAPMPRPMGFYVVAPDAEWVGRAARAGADTVQLRRKDLAGEALRSEIRAALRAVEGAGAMLMIDDHWRLAIEEGAFGVHLGQEDLDSADVEAIKEAGLRLGVSTHADGEIDRALALRPSYMAIGAIFPTATKVMPTKPQGLGKLNAYVRRIRSESSAPIVAIGGIDLGNAESVLACGVDSIAVVRAVTLSDDPEGAVQAFRRMLIACGKLPQA